MPILEIIGLAEQIEGTLGPELLALISGHQDTPVDAKAAADAAIARRAASDQRYDDRLKEIQGTL